jgi:hypothetical protein
MGDKIVEYVINVNSPLPKGRSFLTSNFFWSMHSQALTWERGKIFKKHPE